MTLWLQSKRSRAMIKYRCPVFLFMMIFFFLGGGIAFAQHPDAGTLLQEQRQPTTALPDRLPSDDKPEVAAPPLTDKGIMVLVKGFRFPAV